MQPNALNKFVQSVYQSKAITFKQYTGARMDMLVESVDTDKIVYRTPLELHITYDCASKTQKYRLYHIKNGSIEDIKAELYKLFRKWDKPACIEYAFMAVSHHGMAGFCHMNTLIFTYKDSTVRLFEPHGTPRVKMAEMIGVFFRDVIARKFNVNKWKFEDMKAAPGRNHVGLQTQGERGSVEKGLCVLWNFYVVQYIIQRGLNIRPLYNKESNNLRWSLLFFIEPFWNKVKTKKFNNYSSKALFKTYQNMSCHMSQPINLTENENENQGRKRRKKN